MIHNLTVEELDKLLLEFPELQYPKYLRNNIYELTKGCFTNKQGLDDYNKTFSQLIKNYGKGINN